MVGLGLDFGAAGGGAGLGDAGAARGGVVWAGVGSSGLIGKLRGGTCRLGLAGVGVGGFVGYAGCISLVGVEAGVLATDAYDRGGMFWWTGMGDRGVPVVPVVGMVIVSVGGSEVGGGWVVGMVDGMV